MPQDAPFPRSLLPALVAAGLAAPALAQTPPNAGTLLQELRSPALTVPRADPSVLPEAPALRPPMPAGGARVDIDSKKLELDGLLPPPAGLDAEKNSKKATAAKPLK